MELTYGSEQNSACAKILRNPFKEMCGILIFSDKFEEHFNRSYGQNDNRAPDYFLRRRGPDETREIHYDGITFRHYHLRISYNPRQQPFYEDGIIAIFNGEIYGGDHVDGDNILPAFSCYGKNYTNTLDGEYAIAIYEEANKLLYLSTDVFGTKPLFFGFSEEGLIISSYKSAIHSAGLKAKRVAANTTIIINTEENVISEICHPYRWTQQSSPSDLEEWCAFFDSAMEKRTVSSGKPMYIGLSGGYDSGIISCYLAKKVNTDKFSAVSVLNNNEASVQLSRMSYFKNNIKLTWTERAECESLIYANQNIEPLNCIEYSTGTGYYSKKPMTMDSGFKKLIYVANAAAKSGWKIFLDGMGGDEIYSDYGWNGKRLGIHSNFGGLFPVNTYSMVPQNPYDKRVKWASFYNSTMRTYLSKSEHVIGSFGQESRYPLLDRSLVNCFLGLPSEVKNAHYKAPLRYYMRKYDWPMLESEKHGF